MRLGLFPGQQEFLRQAVRDADKYRGARRRFLAVFGIGVAGAAGAGYFGGRASAATGKAPEPTKDPASRLLADMKRIATGPMAELLERHAPFLACLDDHPDESLLWLGFERLGQMALLDASVALRQRLLTTARAKTVPEAFAPIVARLERG